MVNLEMQNVSPGYGHEVVLKDVTSKVALGEMVGLIGRTAVASQRLSGLSVVLFPPTQVRYYWMRETSPQYPGEIWRIYLVWFPRCHFFEAPLLPLRLCPWGGTPHLGLFQYEGSRELAITWQAMEKTRIQSLAKRRISDLSGGEIQCLLIARVLVEETRVILLDEPTPNLDIGRQVEILDLIRDLCTDNNVTVLAALHDLNLAAQYCDRLVMINNGRVHAEGTPEQVITAQNIEDIYGARGCVYAHPVNDLPAVPAHCRE